MIKELKWGSSVKFDMQQVAQKIKQLEAQWQIKFPHKYIEIVLKNDSAIPYVKNLKGEWTFGGLILPKGEKNEGIELLSLKEEEFRGQIVTTFEMANNKFSEALPEKVYPFAENGSGDAILFDYRKNEYDPEIVFVDHDDLITEDWLSEEDLKQKPLEEWQNEKIYPVCKSFSEFLDLIGLIE